MINTGKSLQSLSQIRNFSIISHVDHGKTTLSDHIMAEGGMLPTSLAGKLKALDFLPQEQNRGITIESSLVSFYLLYNNKQYLLNLIDTPGHVDFSGKVAESLRLVDAGLIIVDSVEGVMAQTKTVVGQAIKEKLKLVLFINKIDRLITELQLDLRGIENKIKSIIGEISSICYKFGLEDNEFPNFSRGTVLLGSALHGWGIDQSIVKSGTNISDIINYYDSNKIQELSNKLPLKKLITKVIIEDFLDPIAGQKRKFPDLIVNSISDKTLELLVNCDANARKIGIIGRRFFTQKFGSHGYIVRMISGTLRQSNKLKSVLTKNIVTIDQIFMIRGKNKLDIDELGVGNIGVIILKDQILPGDILFEENGEEFQLRQIPYVQDPVVAISLEPVEIQDMEDLEMTLQSISQITPGLEFETNLDTGELLVSGVGTLQLEVLVMDIESLGIKVNVSEPIIVKYDIPLREKTGYLELKSYPNITIHSGKTSDLEFEHAKNIIFEDQNENRLICLNNLSSEFLDGLKEVFSNYVNNNPNTGNKLKNFSLILKFDGTKDINSYEEGLIIMSKVLKYSSKLCKITTHEPYYQLKINSPEEYLGKLINELQKAKGKIIDVSTNNFEAEIISIIPVKFGINIADRFRQVSDGNVFWSFPKIIFVSEEG